MCKIVDCMSMQNRSSKAVPQLCSFHYLKCSVYFLFFLISLHLEHVKPGVIMVTYQHVVVIILLPKVIVYYSVIYFKAYNSVTAMHYSVNTVKLIKKLVSIQWVIGAIKDWITARLFCTTNLGKYVNCVKNRDIINTLSPSYTTFSLAQQPVWVCFPKTLS